MLRRLKVIFHGLTKLLLLWNISLKSFTGQPNLLGLVHPHHGYSDPWGPAAESTQTQCPSECPCWMFPGEHYHMFGPNLPLSRMTISSPEGQKHAFLLIDLWFVLVSFVGAAFCIVLPFLNEMIAADLTSLGHSCVQMFSSLNWTASRKKYFSVTITSETDWKEKQSHVVWKRHRWYVGVYVPSFTCYKHEHLQIKKLFILEFFHASLMCCEDEAQLFKKKKEENCEEEKWEIHLSSEPLCPSWVICSCVMVCHSCTYAIFIDSCQDVQLMKWTNSCKYQGVWGRGHFSLNTYKPGRMSASLHEPQGNVTQPICTFCTYFMNVNWSYVDVCKKVRFLQM